MSVILAKQNYDIQSSTVFSRQIKILLIMFFRLYWSERPTWDELDGEMTTHQEQMAI